MKTVIGTMTALVGAALLFAGAARADVIMDSSARLDALLAAEKLGPPEQARDAAMMHVAMFDAVNAIDRRYQPYGAPLVAAKNTSRDAALATAAQDVLDALFPQRRAEFDPEFAARVAMVEDVAARERGVALGHKAAAQVIASRANDGMDVHETYRPATKPGDYIPTAMPVSSTIGGLKPWIMTSPEQFRPGPPPALDSAIWTRDVNEIREVGGLNSQVRTGDQTTAGKFWFQVGGSTYNPIIRQVAEAKHLDLVDCARLYALASTSAADAFIAVFEAKYHYNFWRPVTAIRNADQTGNAATPRDASWLPLGDTPMHPEYPCAHCISSAAVATVLTALYGDAQDINLTSRTAPGVTRHFVKLSDYVTEVSNARIWAGFHYRNSTEVGQKMGREIAERALATRFQPRR